MEQGAGGKDGEFLSEGEKSAREKMAEGRLKGRNVNQVQRSVCTKLRWGGRESLRGANIGEKRVKGEGECSARDGWAASFVLDQGSRALQGLQGYTGLSPSIGFPRHLGEVPGSQSWCWFKHSSKLGCCLCTLPEPFPKQTQITQMKE